MLSINNITYFQNKSRIDFLIGFRDRLSEYFNNAKMNTYVEARIENDRASQLRQEINYDIEQAARIVTAANVNIHITQYPPPMVGGPILNIDLIRNVFQTYIGVSNVHVFDVIDKAIGSYKSNSKSAIIRTINPFYYLDLLLTYFTSLILHPVRLLLPQKPYVVVSGFLKFIEYAFLIYQVYDVFISKLVFPK